jgi:hypothetical protein
MTPTEARDYISNFKHVLGLDATYVRLSSGREIHFDSMTDDDAVLVATGLKQIEVAAADGTKGTQ